MVARKEVQAESFQHNLQNQVVGREETFLQTFLIILVEVYSVPKFCGNVETEEDEEATVPLDTYVNSIWQSVFSNVEVYISNQQKYLSNGLFAQFCISKNLKGVISEYKGILQCKVYV